MGGKPGTELVLAAARNLAAWHACSLGALDIGSVETPGYWAARRAPPPIYHSVITLQEGARDAQLAMVRDLMWERDAFSVCDSWDRLPLGDDGFAVFERGTWLARLDEPARSYRPPLDIERVRDVAALREFETVSIDGFGSLELHGLGTLALHAPAILDDPRMGVLLGRVDGAPVAASMSYVTDDVVGVYGVATLPRHRRRGYGEAMTWAATLMAPDRAAVMQPSALGVSTYRRMGFGEIGRFTNWSWATDAAP